MNPRTRNRPIQFRLRSLLLLTFAVAVVLGVVIPLGRFVLDPFGGFAGTDEFGDLSGRAAKRRLRDAWPPTVDCASVQSASHKTDWSRDSYSSWYRIELTKDAATRWMDHVHGRQERDSRACLHHLHEGVEGVHRTVAGPPPTHWQTGATPAWWSPPAIEFRATEVMLWYTNYHSGVGRATYSGFDEPTNTLWVYDYACQHDTLWSHGNVPEGSTFGMDAE